MWRAMAQAAAAICSRQRGISAGAKGSCSLASTGAAEPLFRFGAIADVQYADVDDAHNFRGNQFRRYRGALKCLERAVEDWTRGPSLDFIADLGDLIDQQCEVQGDSHEALQRVLKVWESAPSHVLHLVGNHELYNFSREEVARLIPNITPWYRSWRQTEGWRVLVLDAYELNAAERGGGQAFEQGIEYLSRRNPNDLRAPRGSIDVAQGLNGLERRFVPMGGGLGAEQLRWLGTELEAARLARQKVIILTHIPVHPQATVAGALLWNYEEVLEQFRSVGRGTVALVLAGHFHSGAYSWDHETGTHHVTLQSPLHAEPAGPQAEAHCTLEVFHDRLEIRGRGIVPSRTLPLVEIPPLTLPREDAVAAVVSQLMEGQGDGDGPDQLEQHLAQSRL